MADAGRRVGCLYCKDVGFLSKLEFPACCCRIVFTYFLHFFTPHNVHSPLSSGICHASVYTFHDSETVLRSLVTLSVGKMGTFSPCCVCINSFSAIDHADHCPPHTAPLFPRPHSLLAFLHLSGFSFPSHLQAHLFYLTIEGQNSTSTFATSSFNLVHCV